MEREAQGGAAGSPAPPLGGGGPVRLRGSDVVSLANLLTVARLPLAALVWWAAADTVAFVAVLAVAGASDVVDGFVARRLRRRHLARTGDVRAFEASRALGAWLDPLCDKAFVVSALAALAVRLAPPVALVALVAARELVVAALLAVRVVGPWRLAPYDFTANPLGKLATVCQFAALALLALGHPAFPAVAVAAGVVGVAAPLVHVVVSLRKA